MESTIALNITEEHIKRAEFARNQPDYSPTAHCPTAQALNDLGYDDVSVGFAMATIYEDHEPYVFLTGQLEQIIDRWVEGREFTPGVYTLTLKPKPSNLVKPDKNLLDK